MQRWVSRDISQRRKRWGFRVGVGGSSSGAQWYTYDTAEEAERERVKAAKAAARLNEQASALTWRQAIEAYCLDRSETCNPKSIVTLRRRLTRFFAPVLDGPAKTTEAGVQALYDALRPTVSVQDHRHCLGRSKALGAWMVKRGHWRESPLAKIEPVGRPKKGKPQLTRDEARALLAWCLVQPDHGPAAVACLLTFGLRSSELLGLTTRDLDDGGALLHVRGTKSEAARRSLVVPYPTAEAPHVPDMRAVLLARAEAARQREAGAEVPSIAPLLWDRGHWWLHREVRRCCQMAGVPQVNPHGLRGTWASMARAAGAAPLIVAQAMGHAGVAIQDQHYVRPEAAHAGQQEAALSALTRR